MQQNKTFSVEVDGIGHFIFKHRTMRIELRIGAEYSRLTDGVENPSMWLDRVSTMIATLTVLAVESPDNWDIETMDPADIDSYKNIALVYNALRGQEARFRGKPNRAGEEKREGNSGHDRPVVSTDLSANAE